jgi:hypothetical protein
MCIFLDETSPFGAARLARVRDLANRRVVDVDPFSRYRLDRR